MATAHRPEDTQQFAERQGTTGGRTGQGWDNLEEEAGEVAGVAVERARHFLDSAKEQATNYIDKRKNEALQPLMDLANSLRETGGAFGERPNMQAFVDSAANGLEQLAGTIRDKSVADIFGDVEAAVRRHPAAAAAATLAAGFLLARFIKASTERARNFDERRRPEASGWPQGSQATGPNAMGHGQTRV